MPNLTLLQPWRSNLSLWPRMALAISLGFLTLFVAFSFLGERALEDSTGRILEERLVIAQMAATQIDGVLEEYITELKRANRFSDFNPEAMKITAQAEMLAYTQGQGESSTSGIIFLDPKGSSILLHPPNLYPAGTDLLKLDYVSQAFKSRRVTISEPFYDPVSDQHLAAIAVPVTEEGNLFGLLIGAVDLKNQAIQATLQQAATLGISGHASLFNREGLSLASTYAVPFLTPGEHPTFYRRAMASMKPVVEIVPVEIDLPGENKNELHVMAFVPLQMVPWGVAVGGDENETFAGVRRLRLGMVILGTIALAGVWAATLVGTRSLLKPVRELTRSAQKIAEGNLHLPLHISQKGEIGDMAAALERMRLQLLANIEELSRWNETLETRVREKTEDLRQQQALIRQLLRRAITAQEEERARISRELHDEIGQTLTAVQLNLDRLAKSMSESQNEALKKLEKLRALTDQALINLRRVIAAMRPGVLDELGLVPALAWIVDQTLQPLGVIVHLEAEEMNGRLPSEIETVLFRIAQEAIHNVARHSQAKHLTIQLRQEDGSFIMTLVDDGLGWDPRKASSDTDRSRRLGLASMKERALLVNGRVQVKSAPGKGTIVRVVIPISPSENTTTAEFRMRN